MPTEAEQKATDVKAKAESDKAAAEAAAAAEADAKAKAAELAGAPIPARKHFGTPGLSTNVIRGKK